MSTRRRDTTIGCRASWPHSDVPSSRRSTSGWTSGEAIFDRYVEGLGDLDGLSFMPEAPYGRSNRWLTAVLIDRDAFGATNDDVMAVLARENIESRPVWKPMHMQPAFAGSPMTGGAVSERLFAAGLCLPSGSALQPQQQDRVIEIVREVAKV